MEGSNGWQPGGDVSSRQLVLWWWLTGGESAVFYMTYSSRWAIVTPRFTSISLHGLGPLWRAVEAVWGAAGVVLQGSLCVAGQAERRVIQADTEQPVVGCGGATARLEPRMLGRSSTPMASSAVYWVILLSVPLTYHWSKLAGVTGQRGQGR